MKKFAFTLQAVYDYKLTVEKMQKTELAKVDTLLRELYAAKQALSDAFDRNNRARDAELLEKTADAQTLEAYEAFFRHIREERKKLAVKIKNAETAKLRCQEVLIITMREIKTYNKLRGKQYQEYLKEAAAEEEKELSDIISFSVAADT
ncbi:MAG: hypothetical protein GX823_06375 [Clostridiales bacterium]|nr:hypothetical protein [Clostridiales bacterium]